MVGKRIQFDDETWEALQALARQKGRTFQQLADEAFAELLRRFGQPVGLKAALKESVGAQGRKRR
jgi:predicted transcriptional regulator